MLCSLSTIFSRALIIRSWPWDVRKSVSKYPSWITIVLVLHVLLTWSNPGFCTKQWTYGPTLCLSIPSLLSLLQNTCSPLALKCEKALNWSSNSRQRSRVSHRSIPRLFRLLLKSTRVAGRHRCTVPLKETVVLIRASCNSWKESRSSITGINTENETVSGRQIASGSQTAPPQIRSGPRNCSTVLIGTKKENRFINVQCLHLGTIVLPVSCHLCLISNIFRVGSILSF